MIDLHYWPTPNGWKISIALEEMELPYTIADMACWPWIVPHERHGQHIEEFANLHRWYEALKERPALRRGFDVGKEIRPAKSGGPDAGARKVLFGQRARPTS